jgi:oligosaccharyltransferase complex subunit beta
VLKSSNVTAPSIIVPASKEKVVFSGIGINYSKDSRFITSVLATGLKDIVRNEFKKSEVTAASNVVLAFQGRNNARAIFSGSIDVCSNQNINSEKSSNEKFCTEFSKWVLNEKGVLRYTSITHHRQIEKHEKGYLEGEYTINDDLYYSIEIEENVGGKWQRFKTQNAYLEFVMMDPKIRKYLENSNEGLVSRFKAPDVHGVYQFKTFLYEHGYSWIETASKVTVRPYRHNQFERFLVCAGPYYASVFASISGFVLFSFSFLYHKNS